MPQALPTARRVRRFDVKERDDDTICNLDSPHFLDDSTDDLKRVFHAAAVAESRLRLMQERFQPL